MPYHTDTEYLAFLSARIGRLKQTLARAEAIALKSSASVGVNKTYVDAREIEKQLYRTIAEYDAVSARVAGNPYDPTIKTTTLR